MSSKIKITGIVRKENTNDFYVKWEIVSPDKKIYKKVYVSKKDPHDKQHKTRKHAANNFVVKWYYAVGEGNDDTKNPKYYLDKTSTTFGSGVRNSSSDLWTLPEGAIRIEAKVIMTSDTYKSSATKSSHWFSTCDASSTLKGMNLIPEVPTMETPTTTAMKLSSHISFDPTDEVNAIQVQGYMNDSANVAFDSGWIDVSSYTSIGQFLFEENLSTVGTYRIRARSRVPIGASKGYVTPTSKWSDLSSPVDTAPGVPTLISCSAQNSTSIKVAWASVTGVTQYHVEYVSDTNDNFDLGQAQSITVDNATQVLIPNLTLGTTYYVRVKSVATLSGGNVESSPSKSLSTTLATAPAAPTTWSSVTVAIIASTLETTKTEYLYFTHNTKDNSAMRTAKIKIIIGTNTYYYLFTNTSVDDYGQLKDTINEIDLWNLKLYSTEGSNDTLIGTLYDLFKQASVSSFKWSVSTKGIGPDYGDWSVVRTVNAYEKPTLVLQVLGYDSNPLISNIMTSFPLNVKGVVTPISQTPIGFYIGIVANETYEDVDYKGETITIPAGTEVVSKYVDSNLLDIVLSVSDMNLRNGISYTINFTAYLDSGLTATDKYSFTTSWDDDKISPEAEINYNDNYRYCVIRPYSEYYLGYDGDNDGSNNTVYYGTNITGTSTDPTVFSSSGIENASTGDMYFNNSTYMSYTCVTPGNADTATWIYKTTFGFETVGNWYFGLMTTVNSDSDPIPASIIENALVNDRYFNTVNGDIYRCITSGTPDIAVWEYECNIAWGMTPNVLLNVYRVNGDGSFSTIQEGIDNLLQNTDAAIYVRDPHPNFGTCRYKIVAIDKNTGATSFEDVSYEIEESSIIVQWDEKWIDNDNPFADSFEGSVLELPANIKISDSSSPDVTLAEYAGRDRPVSYYGTQLGESPNFDCEFPKEDENTLALLRHLKRYMGDVYIREPSGLGYWASIKVSYNRNYSDLTVSVTLDIQPVEGGA